MAIQLWRSYLRSSQGDRLQCHFEIISAIIMISLHPQSGIAIDITGSDGGIVDTRRGVLQQRQNRPSVVSDQLIADPGRQSIEPWPYMLHRQKLSGRVGIKRPHVTHLRPILFYDREMLPLA